MPTCATSRPTRPAKDPEATPGRSCAAPWKPPPPTAPPPPPRPTTPATPAPPTPPATAPCNAGTPNGVGSAGRRKSAIEADGEGQDRTGDTTIFSRVLYQLSYLAGRRTVYPPGRLRPRTCNGLRDGATAPRRPVRSPASAHVFRPRSSGIS